MQGPHASGWLSFLHEALLHWSAWRDPTCKSIVWSQSLGFTLCMGMLSAVVCKFTLTSLQPNSRAFSESSIQTIHAATFRCRNELDIDSTLCISAGNAKQ